MLPAMEKMEIGQPEPTEPASIDAGVPEEFRAVMIAEAERGRQLMRSQKRNTGPRRCTDPVWALVFGLALCAEVGFYVFALTGAAGGARALKLPTPEVPAPTSLSESLPVVGGDSDAATAVTDLDILQPTVTDKALHLENFGTFSFQALVICAFTVVLSPVCGAALVAAISVGAALVGTRIVKLAPMPLCQQIWVVACGLLFVGAMGTGGVTLGMAWWKSWSCVALVVGLGLLRLCVPFWSTLTGEGMTWCERWQLVVGEVAEYRSIFSTYVFHPTLKVKHLMLFQAVCFVLAISMAPVLLLSFMAADLWAQTGGNATRVACSFLVCKAICQAGLVYDLAFTFSTQHFDRLLVEGDTAFGLPKQAVSFVIMSFGTICKGNFVELAVGFLFPGSVMAYKWVREKGLDRCFGGAMKQKFVDHQLGRVYAALRGSPLDDGKSMAEFRKTLDTKLPKKRQSVIAGCSVLGAYAGFVIGQMSALAFGGPVVSVLCYGLLGAWVGLVSGGGLVAVLSAWENAADKLEADTMIGMMG